VKIASGGMDHGIDIETVDAAIRSGSVQRRRRPYGRGTSRQSCSR
jgi:hypothetical protein